MEHHSNLVPWQMICRERGASLRVIPVNDDGSLDVTAGEELVTDATRLVAITAVSNVLGTVTPIERLIEKAHSHDAAVLVDAAQGVPHQPMDVQQLDCDFCAFSAHKLYAATGTGVLYGKREHLEQMRPWQYGGGMIDSVRFDETSFAEPPYRFEAGTRHVAGGVALSAAIRYVNDLGWDALEAHEQDLLRYATTRLGEQDGLTIHGTAEPKRSLVSFTLDGVNPSDAAAVLDKLGIAVRAGHHCAQPLMERLGVSGTVRASFACYNTRDEVDRLIEGIGRVRRMLT
jgi:cysteine desulfurase/selenocysteine lyase